MNDNIRERLFAAQDSGYKAFTQKLVPTLNPDCIIGVRTPYLKELAKELFRADGYQAFLSTPHRFFEENQLHAFITAQIKDFGLCLAQTERFLPQIDNWATCDQFSPAALAKKPQELLEKIRLWLKSGEVYTVRFALNMLMRHFLDKNFTPEILSAAAEVNSEEYYIQMGQAWFFATALAKQYESAIYVLEKNLLSAPVHNKTIQKARESRRLSAEQKARLTTLKR